MPTFVVKILEAIPPMITSVHRDTDDDSVPRNIRATIDIATWEYAVKAESYEEAEKVAHRIHATRNQTT